MPNLLDRNANSLGRLRRNAQRLSLINSTGGGGGTLIISSTGGLVSTSSGLGILLPSTSGLMLNSTGLSVSYPSVLYSAYSSAPITNTTATTNFSLAYTAPAGSLNVLGRKIKWQLFFTLQALNAVTDTLTINILYGSTSVAVFSTLPVGTLNAGTPMDAALSATTTSTGPSGGVQVAGTIFLNGLRYVIPYPTTATGGINLTAAQSLAVSATWSVAAANDIITLDDIVLEQVA